MAASHRSQNRVMLREKAEQAEQTVKQNLNLALIAGKAN